MTLKFDEPAEVSFSDVIVRLWRGRGLILIITAIALALGVIYIAATAVKQHRLVVYFIDLNGIANERYPGGAAFSPQDLLAPEVLAEVRKRFNIDPSVKLREALTVSYGSPIAEGLHKTYQARLAARNLSQSEIAAINQEYLSELHSASRSTVQIDVNYAAMSMDASLGVTLARALPDIWAQIYSTRFKTFSDNHLVGAAAAAAGENMKSVASVLVVDASLSAMRRGIKILSEDNRLSGIQTQDGVTIADFAHMLNRFQTIYFDVVKSFAFQSKDSVSKSYIASIRHKLAEIDRNMRQHDTTLEKLLGSRQAQNDVDAQHPQVSPSGREGVQLTESGLSEILKLAERASSNQVIHKILLDRQALALEASSLQRELDFITTDEQIVESDIARAQATEIFKNLSSQYNEILRRAEETLRERTLLYASKLGPIVQGSFLPRWAILFLAVAGAAGGLLGVLAALIFSSMQQRNVAARRSIPPASGKIAQTELVA